MSLHYQIGHHPKNPQDQAKLMKQRYAHQMEIRVRGTEWTKWENVTVHDAVEKDVAESSNEGTHKGDSPRNVAGTTKQS
jgi:hypothetical protein